MRLSFRSLDRALDLDSPHFDERLVVRILLIGFTAIAIIASVLGWAG